jgi:hypothetical protein
MHDGCDTGKRMREDEWGGFNRRDQIGLGSLGNARPYVGTSVQCFLPISTLPCLRVAYAFALSSHLHFFVPGSKSCVLIFLSEALAKITMLN